jgi:hypothetical protein
MAVRDDYVVELIRRAGEAIARALDLWRERDLQRAEAEAAEALRRLAKLPRDTITLLDVATLVPLIGGGDPESLRLCARALWLLGEIDDARGDAEPARRSYLRAMQLYKEAGLGDDPRDAEAAAALAAKFG